MKREIENAKNEQRYDGDKRSTAVKKDKKSKNKECLVLSERIKSSSVLKIKLELYNEQSFV